MLQRNLLLFLEHFKRRLLSHLQSSPNQVSRQPRAPHLLSKSPKTNGVVQDYITDVANLRPAEDSLRPAAILNF
jgi:hypothetical protein